MEVNAGGELMVRQGNAERSAMPITVKSPIRTLDQAEFSRIAM